MATPIPILAPESKPLEVSERGALLVAAGLGVVWTGAVVDVDVAAVLVMLEALVLPSEAAVGRMLLFVVRLK